MKCRISPWIARCLLATVALTGCHTDSAKPAAGPANASARSDGGTAATIAAREDDDDFTSQARALVPVTPRDPSWGSRRALVTIVEFADFECPYCAKAAKTIDALRAKYGPEALRVVWKNVPLPGHRHARATAEAAMGVFTLGGAEAFWRFASDAFGAQRELSDAAYARWATSAGVDAQAIQRGLTAGTWRAKVEEDAALAESFGINGTPTFLVNGVPIAGAYPAARFEILIDEEIRKANARVAQGTPRGRLYAEATRANLEAVANEAARAEEEAAKADAPDLAVYRVPIGTAPTRGPKDALVTIVEYSDFECPFCKQVEPTLAELRAAYPGKIRIVWKNDPLPFHSHATAAAEWAAEARAQKGDAAFWTMHDKLFESQSHLDDETFERLARESGLDVARARGAVAMHAHAAAITAETNEAEGFRANGTPHFFVNGRRLVGAQPLEAFRVLVDEELTKAQALVGKGVAPARVYEMVTKDGVGGK